jgi:hypothetical protein
MQIKIPKRNLCRSVVFLFHQFVVIYRRPRYLKHSKNDSPHILPRTIDKILINRPKKKPHSRAGPVFSDLGLRCRLITEWIPHVYKSIKESPVTSYIGACRDDAWTTQPPRLFRTRILPWIRKFGAARILPRSISH